MTRGHPVRLSTVHLPRQLNKAVFIGMYAVAGIFLLPAQRIRTNLRSRRHNFQLPDCYSALHKRSFVIRTLFEFV